MVRNAPAIALGAPEIAVVAVAAKISNHQGNYFLQIFPQYVQKRFSLGRAAFVGCSNKKVTSIRKLYTAHS